MVSEEGLVQAHDEIDARTQKICSRHIPFRVNDEVLRVSLGKPFRRVPPTRVEQCGVVSIRKVSPIKREMEAVDCKQNDGWNKQYSKDRSERLCDGFGFWNSHGWGRATGEHTRQILPGAILRDVPCVLDHGALQDFPLAATGESCFLRRPKLPRDGGFQPTGPGGPLVPIAIADLFPATNGRPVKHESSEHAHKPWKNGRYAAHL